MQQEHLKQTIIALSFKKIDSIFVSFVKAYKAIITTINTMTVPYVIMITYPGDHAKQYFGSTKEDKLNDLILNTICEFILEYQDIHSIDSSEDITNFIETYYTGYYVENMPWETHAYVENDWKHHVPSTEEIVNHIMKMKTGMISMPVQKMDEEPLPPLQSNSQHVLLRPDLTNGEKEIIFEMMLFVDEYLDDYLDECNENNFNEMNDLEQIVFIVDKLLLNSDKKEYPIDTKLFNEFSDIILKCVIRNIEASANEDLLESLTDVYDKIMKYKELSTKTV